MATARMGKKQAARAEACDKLCEILKPGDTVLCVLRSVSRSGMSRRIDFYAKGADLRYLSGYISTALDIRFPGPGERGLRVDGCGMDMGFHVVYSLARTLWPSGFECVKGDASGRCPSNDHSNGEHSSHHMDGGYALRSEWL